MDCMCIVLYCTVLYGIVLYGIVLYGIYQREQAVGGRKAEDECERVRRSKNGADMSCCM